MVTMVRIPVITSSTCNTLCMLQPKSLLNKKYNSAYFHFLKVTFMRSYHLFVSKYNSPAIHSVYFTVTNISSTSNAYNSSHYSSTIHHIFAVIVPYSLQACLFMASSHFCILLLSRLIECMAYTLETK